MRTLFLLAVIVSFTSLVDAQTRRNRTRSKTTKPAAVVPAPSPTPEPAEPAIVKAEPKKNERPAALNVGAPAPIPSEPNYYYEFTQPEFPISKIVIEHDDAGKGTITFTKKLFDEKISDPLQVSPAALERINAAYTALNFLESSVNYQYEKDYSHLGVATFKLKRDGKQRTAVFNYTTNKDAKVLADEYRKLANQFVWIFEIGVARDNQPLESPRLLDSLDSLIRRNEISDPRQLIPLLNAIGDDERVPLISRNHARKLVEKIGKVSNKQ